MKNFYIIVACTKDGGIGKDGTIPWHLPPDFEYFRRLTTETLDRSRQNAVIMGRNTWNSLPKRPLKGRRNIVLTSSKDVSGIIAEGGEVHGCLDDALYHLSMDEKVEKIFVIGGERVYREAIDNPLCECVFATMIENADGYDCDTFFPIQKLTTDRFVYSGSTFGMEYDKISYSYLRFWRKII